MDNKIEVVDLAPEPVANGVAVTVTPGEVLAHVAPTKGEPVAAFVPGEAVPADKFTYKGNDVIIKAFLNEKNVAEKLPLAIQLNNVEVAAIAGNFGGSQKVTKLPKLLLITGVQQSPYGPAYVHVNYAGYATKTPFRAGALSLPLDFKVKHLTGKQAEKMISLYDKHQLANLNMNLAHNFSIGSDPEVFVTDGRGDVFCAFDFLGSKTSGKNLTSEGKAVYWDGPQAEFETTAIGCLAYHVDSIHAGLKAVYDAARVKNKKAKLSIRNVMEIPKKVLDTAADEHILFGCMPSQNVYKLDDTDNTPPRELPYRSTGGHIHFGIGPQSQQVYEECVRALDSILGVACVSLFAKFDNPVRRQKYGRAGEYRTPKHGLEYRCLSNAWLMHPVITHLVFELSRKALMFGKNGFRKYWQATEQETVECIQTCNVELAHTIMERNRPLLMQILKAAYPYLGNDGVEKAYSVFWNGAGSAVKDPEDLEGNWNLNSVWQTHSGSKNKCLSVAKPDLMKNNLL